MDINIGVSFIFDQILKNNDNLDGHWYVVVVLMIEVTSQINICWIYSCNKREGRWPYAVYGLNMIIPTVYQNKFKTWYGIEQKKFNEKLLW